MQGELQPVTNANPVRRAIPARAGRTLRQLYDGCPDAGHPCACRENKVSRAESGVPAGPSLRVQGELEGGSVPGGKGRAIPARAGRTIAASSIDSPSAGHPCACRENSRGVIEVSAEGGPSLRVQGEPPEIVLRARRTRAIPARAGRTGNLRECVRRAMGHPCACRENYDSGGTSIVAHGPSLRVQGELFQILPYVPIVRAIPARAGRTDCVCEAPEFKTGHPCACRENAPHWHLYI